MFIKSIHGKTRNLMLEEPKSKFSKKLSSTSNVLQKELLLPDKEIVISFGKYLFLYQS